MHTYRINFYLLLSVFYAIQLNQNEILLAHNCRQDQGFLMEDPGEILATRFSKARKEAGVSRRSLARATDNSPAQIDNIENGKYVGSRHGPCLFGVGRAAEHLRVSIDHLLPSASRADAREFLLSHPGIEFPSTPISVLSEHLAFCDIYSKPSQDMTYLKRTGPKSFLVQKSGLSDPALINAEFMSWSLMRRKRVCERQMKMWKQVKLAELDFFDEDSPTLGRRYRTEFLLAACRTVDFDGEEVLAILCEPM